MMTAYANELRINIVRPVLEKLGLWSEVAEALVLGTAAHESGGFLHREQVGGGPAKGLWQIEPPTADDTLHWCAGRHTDLFKVLESFANPDFSEEQNLRDNDHYACALCRLIYFRRSVPLPADPNDVEALARYWGRFYQTGDDPAKERQWVEDYRRYVDGA